MNVVLRLKDTRKHYYFIIMKSFAYEAMKISNHGTEILQLMIKYYIILSLFIDPIKMHTLVLPE